MSELIISPVSAGMRRQLLATVSGLTLLACTGMASASSGDEERPTVWIELGGQLDRIDGTGNRFTPAFASVTPTPDVYTPVSPIGAQQPPRYGYGGEGKLSFQPEGASWIFSAAVRYGRSNGNKHVQHQAPFDQVHHVLRYDAYPSFNYSSTIPATLARFNDTRSRQDESHTILDFQVGKDVGLGLFGRHGSSTFAAGIRFAQFTSRATFDAKARPDLEFYNGFAPINGPGLYFYKAYAHFHAYTAAGSATRSFRGVGPSLSWEGSSPLAGNTENAQLALDWGANAALLFGRQKANVTHQTTANTFRQKYYPRYHVATAHGGHNNSRSIIVPNVGAFAGLSVNFPNSKVSLGYRADFFFGAMDVGIDDRKSQTTSFHGPFAKISVGLGG